MSTYESLDNIKRKLTPEEYDQYQEDNITKLFDSLVDFCFSPLPRDSAIATSAHASSVSSLARTLDDIVVLPNDLCHSLIYCNIDMTRPSSLDWVLEGSRFLRQYCLREHKLAAYNSCVKTFQLYLIYLLGLSEHSRDVQLQAFLMRFSAENEFLTSYNSTRIKRRMLSANTSFKDWEKLEWEASELFDQHYLPDLQLD
jgi:hypothetical protein